MLVAQEKNTLDNGSISLKMDEDTVNPLYNDTVCPQKFDVKLNFCCNRFKFKLYWYIWANTIDVVKNFTVIKNVAIKSFHCNTCNWLHIGKAI